MKRREAYSYGCLMVTLPEPLAEKVRGFGASIPDGRLFRGNEDAPGGRVEKVHITVKYGLLTDDPEEMEAVVEDVEPFPVTLGRSGAFYNKDAVVLKIGVESKGLVALNRKVCLMLNHTNTYPDYRPHVTVAYLAKDQFDPYYWREWCVDDFTGDSFGVDQLEFLTPGGNRYVMPLNGSRALAARRTASTERVARLALARLDVRVSPMEHKVELSDGRQVALLQGRLYEIDRAVKDLKWDISRMTRMELRDAMAFVDEKTGRRGLKWSVVRAGR